MGNASLLDEGVLPHHSTLDAILRRLGQHLRYEADSSDEASSRFEHEASNDLWQMDFKGCLPLFDQRQRCHLLMLLNDYSRFALCLAACANERRQTVQQQLIKVSRRYGLCCMTRTFVRCCNVVAIRPSKEVGVIDIVFINKNGSAGRCRNNGKPFPCLPTTVSYVSRQHAAIPVLLKLPVKLPRIKKPAGAAG